MEHAARATLNDPAIRSRLRREFTRADYSQYPIKRLAPTLLSDVTLRPHFRPIRNIPNTSAQPLNKLRTQQDLAHIEQRTNMQDAMALHRQRANYLTFQQPAEKPIEQSKPRKLHLSLKHWNKLQLSLVALSFFIVLAGGYASFIGLRANHVALAQATKLTAQANVAAVSTRSTSTKPNPALSTVKPTESSLADFVVAPNLPRYIMIPKLGVDTIVESVGVNASGALETPDNVYNTAWYNESAEPGQPGAMLIDGHVSSWTAHGVFYGIKTLAPGDIIKIQRGDGTIFTYTVVKNQVFPSGNVNMQSAITPIVAGQPGLNLITCAGDVIPGTSQFNERILVYATLQQ